jgi:hypothetical protein
MIVTEPADHSLTVKLFLSLVAPTVLLILDGPLDPERIASSQLVQNLIFVIL